MAGYAAVGPYLSLHVVLWLSLLRLANAIPFGEDDEEMEESVEEEQVCVLASEGRALFHLPPSLPPPSLSPSPLPPSVPSSSLPPPSLPLPSLPPSLPPSLHRLCLRCKLGATSTQWKRET